MALDGVPGLRGAARCVCITVSTLAKGATEELSSLGKPLSGLRDEIARGELCAGFSRTEPENQSAAGASLAVSSVR